MTPGPLLGYNTGGKGPDTPPQGIHPQIAVYATKRGVYDTQAGAVGPRPFAGPRTAEAHGLSSRPKRQGGDRMKGCVMGQTR